MIKSSPAPTAKEKKARPPAASLNDETFRLFHANLNAMREWYRAKADRGHNYGIYVTLEIAISDVLTALGAAIEGKTWEPPSS